MSRVDLAACVDLAEGGGPDRVDREAGVIKGVKLLGWSSQNGRTYDPAGVEPGLYEGRVVNFNHHKGAGDRSVYDRFGRVVNVTKRADGLYGDLEYLRSHPHAEMVAEAASRMPNVFGLSHTARGRERRGAAGGPATIERVESVQSVDLVGDPATVAGLYESKGERRMATLNELRESLAKSRPDYARALSEMAEAGIMGPDAAMAEPAPAAEPGADHGQAILDACKACIDDASLAPDEKVKKIKKLLAIHKGDDAAAESDGDEAAGGEGNSGYAANESKTVKTESKTDEAAALAARLQALEARDRLRSAADEAGLRLPKALLESVRPDITEAGAKALVAELKAQQRADAARPRSAAPVVTESKAGGEAGKGGADVKGIARRILAG